MIVLGRAARGGRRMLTGWVNAAAPDVAGQLVDHLDDRATKDHQQLVVADLAHGDPLRMHDERVDRVTDWRLVRTAACPVHALAGGVHIVVRR